MGEIAQDGVTIHIGMPKSASTFLQESIWKTEPSLSACIPPVSGRPYEAAANPVLPVTERMADLVTAVMRLEDRQFQANLPAFVEVADEFRRSARFQVISNEGLACANYAPYGWNSRSVIARRLKDLFPDAKVLLITRNQFDFFTSWFVQMRNTGENLARCRTLVELFDYQMELETLGISSLWGLCDYDELYATYAEVFGPASLNLIPFELLKSDPVGFLDAVAGVVGAGRGGAGREDGSNDQKSKAVNVRHSWLSMGLKNLGRRLPGLKQHVSEDIKQGLLQLAVRTAKAEPKISDTHRRFIAQRYSQGNQWLAQNCGLDLARYGYPGS